MNVVHINLNFYLYFFHKQAQALGFKLNRNTIALEIQVNRILLIQTGTKI